MLEDILIKKEKKINYIDNKKLTTELSVYAELYRAWKVTKEGLRPKMSNYIGKCIIDVAERLSTLPKFYGYTYRDEMVGDGIENCLSYCHNFDGSKFNNAFGYITQIIYYAFLRRIHKEKCLQAGKKDVALNYLLNDVHNSDNKDYICTDFLETVLKQYEENYATSSETND